MGHEDPTRGSVYLYVVLENRGPEPARAIEVDFDSLGVEVWNETGNFPGPYVDVTLSLRGLSDASAC